MKKIYILFSILIFIIQLKAQIVFQSQLSAPYSGESLSNIWGYTDPSGNNYALVGTTDAVSIVDISNPDTPIELHHIPYVHSNAWREIKTYQNYLYATTDAGISESGLLIVDLSGLPGSIDTFIRREFTYTPPMGSPILVSISNIHALHIDEPNARLYCYGSSASGLSSSNGALIFDITNPTSPQLVGNYDANGYVHDGEARNNILHACHIYDGQVAMVDCTNPANPIVLGTVTTPTEFSHNSWISDDNHTMFTTDENNNSFIAAYNITDPTDIIELDRINLGVDAIVHNVYVKNDFLIASYYTEGFIIVDAHEPDMLVIMDQYDTSPASGNIFNGAWGVFPFFDDSTVIVSDIEEGLFVFKANYRRASYVSGIITNSISGDPINNATVTLSSGHNDLSDLIGSYGIGIPSSGTYTITVSAPGYITQTISGIEMSAGNITNLNINLVPLQPIVAIITHANSGLPIANASIMVNNGTNYYQSTANSSGLVNIFPYDSPYNVIVAAWGFQSVIFPSTSLPDSGDYSIVLTPGYYDDFSIDLGWNNTSTATSGQWVLDEPIGTLNDTEPCNPEFDIISDLGDMCYITGNAGGSAGTDDVDDGWVELSSPIMDLTSYDNPYINFYTWFYNSGGSGSPNDYMEIKINNGFTEATLLTLNSSSPLGWNFHNYQINTLIAITNNMRLIVAATDITPGHLVEGGFDKMTIIDSTTITDTTNIHETASQISIYPNPTADNLIIKHDMDENYMVEIIDITGKTFITFINEEKISLFALSKGLYFVKISTKTGKIFSQKIIKY